MQVAVALSNDSNAAKQASGIMLQDIEDQTVFVYKYSL
jgi:hypothetical protein